VEKSIVEVQQNTKEELEIPVSLEGLPSELLEIYANLKPGTREFLDISKKKFTEDERTEIMKIVDEMNKEDRRSNYSPNADEIRDMDQAELEIVTMNTLYYFLTKGMNLHDELAKRQGGWGHYLVTIMDNLWSNRNILNKLNLLTKMRLLLLVKSLRA